MSLIKDDSSYIINPYNILSYDSRKQDGSMPIISIGKYCSIATNATFILSNHLTDRFTNAPAKHNVFSHRQGNQSSYSKGDIIIKNDVWIGANCTILDGLTINNGAVVAAGSVVTKSIPAYAIVGGNPAKLIKYRFEPEVINEIESLNFWDLPINEISKFDLHKENIIEVINDIKRYKGM